MPLVAHLSQLTHLTGASTGGRMGSRPDPRLEVMGWAFSTCHRWLPALPQVILTPREPLKMLPPHIWRPVFLEAHLKVGSKNSSYC